jgi:hypothetical protein
MAWCSLANGDSLGRSQVPTHVQFDPSSCGSGPVAFHHFDVTARALAAAGRRHGGSPAILQLVYRPARLIYFKMRVYKEQKTENRKTRFSVSTNKTRYLSLSFATTTFRFLVRASKRSKELLLN